MGCRYWAWRHETNTTRNVCGQPKRVLHCPIYPTRSTVPQKQQAAAKKHAGHRGHNLWHETRPCWTAERLTPTSDRIDAMIMLLCKGTKRPGSACHFSFSTPFISTIPPQRIHAAWLPVGIAECTDREGLVYASILQTSPDKSLDGRHDLMRISYR